MQRPIWIVLDMSRIESGRVKIEEKEVHLLDALHDLRTIIQSNIAAKQQDLYQDIVYGVRGNLTK